MINPFLDTLSGKARLMQELVRAERANGADTVTALMRVAHRFHFSDEVCDKVAKDIRNTKPRFRKRKP
jgi:hypothetical protein